MTDMNLDEMSLKELKALAKKIDKAIEGFEQRQHQAVLAELEAKAKEHGFKLADLLDGAAPKAKAAPKYRHPENAELTWSGRGRKPKWIAEALDAGRSIEEFAI